MSRQRIIIITQALTTVNQMEIEEVGTNWKTRPNLSLAHDPMVVNQVSPSYTNV